MKNKNGFVFVETIIVLTVTMVSLILLYRSYVLVINRLQQKTYYDNINDVFRASVVKQLLESVSFEGNYIVLLPSAGNCDAYMQTDCATVMAELDINKVFIVRSVTDLINEPTDTVVTNPLKRYLNTIDDYEYTLIIQRGDGFYASLKVGAIGSNESIPGGNAGTSDYKDSSGANYPVLGNLIPIVRSGTDWKYADVTKKWYDYDNGEWANAVVLKNGVTKKRGDMISETEIDLWYVWIPRYEYKLPSDSIGSTGTPKAIDIKFISSSVMSPSTGYSIHPAFTFYGNNKSGLWVSKFEATGTKEAITTKANTASLINVNARDMFEGTRKLNTTYADYLNFFDSHPARYTEWTAISYFTNSIYGRCSSATSCTEVTLTPKSSSKYTTGGGAYETNTSMSTTGNVHGIYDASGGAWELVMGFLESAPQSTDGSKLSGYTISGLPAPRYYDVFTSSDRTTKKYSVMTGVNGRTNYNGIFSELLSDKTKNTTWYGDYAIFINIDLPWFKMGGCDENGTASGIFASSIDEGEGDAYTSIRPVLTIR